MNELLKVFLKNLTDESADEIWRWLDETPYPCDKIIEVICESHPVLKQKYCGESAYIEILSQSDTEIKLPPGIITLPPLAKTTK